MADEFADGRAGGSTFRRSRGVFITFEGPEGAGKTAQIQRLAQRIDSVGITVIRTREPGGTRPGEDIRLLLLELDPDGIELRPETEALLFSAARSELVARVIRPALDNDCIVLCDRFSDSTLAYQGFGRGLETDELRRLVDFATGGLIPDLTLLLDLPVSVGLARKAASSEPLTRLDAAGLAFHERVRAGFHSIAQADPERWRLIDADRDIESVQDDIWRAVASSIGQAMEHA